MLRNLMLSSSLAAILAAVGLGLAGCKPGQDAANAQAAPPPLAALPLTDASTPPGAPAPTASALPRVRPAPIARASSPYDGYAYLDRAYDMNDAFADAPPDYAFDDEDVSPWVWRTDDGWYRLAEPLPDGGDRYYYYEPGADYPFLVRDPDYAYGYSGGELVVVYDSYGRLLPDYEMRRQADYAGRFLARAEQLYSLAQGERRPVAQANWQARRARIVTEADDWRRAQSQQADWRSYHDAHARQDQAHWAPEMYRRDAEAARFARQVNDQAQAERDLKAARAAAQAAKADHVQLASSGPRPAQPSQPGGFERQDLARNAAPPPVVQPGRDATLAARQEQLAAAEADRGARLQAQQQVRQQQLASAEAERQARQAQAQADRQARLDAQQQARQQQQAAAEAERKARQAQAQSERQAQIEARQQARQQQQLAQAQAKSERQARAKSQQADKSGKPDRNGRDRNAGQGPAL